MYIPSYLMTSKSTDVYHLKLLELADIFEYVRLNVFFYSFDRLRSTVRRIRYLWIGELVSWTFTSHT